MNTQQCSNPVPATLKPYMAVKMVSAGPLTRGAYDEWRGQDTPKSYEPGDNGYLVQYYGGYISWCPKEEFEKFNLPLTEYGCITDQEVDLMLGQVSIETREPKTTFAEVNMLTGFYDMDHSSCVRPDNYDEKIGADNAVRKIRNRLWGHLGFMLQWAISGLTGNMLPEIDETDSEPPYINEKDNAEVSISNNQL